MQIPEINFKKRRADAFAAMPEKSALLVLSQPEAVRNGSVEHSYRQHSLLHFLTGFGEPESALLMVKEGGAVTTTMFLREKNPDEEIWSGRRLGVEKAPAALGVDAALSIHSLWDRLPALLGQIESLFVELGLSESYDRHIIKVLRKHKQMHRRTRLAMIGIEDPSPISAALRQRKAPEEVARMKHAAQITKNAFDRVFKMVRPGVNEREVFAVLLGAFHELGAEMSAYNLIVAGGVNATILHYVENNRELHANDLLLIDAGSQYDYYASDVTRTFPVSKRFSAEQRAIYDIVLRTQKNCIEMCRPGATLDAIHEHAISQLVDGLVDVGLLNESRSEIMDKKLYRRFYPHGTSHWIGLDVHDVGFYRDGSDQATKLQAGMYFSVEPGIYIQPDDHAAPERFRGIGVRIEDDVLITDSGCDVITAGIPKEIADLENR
jgi:Xaa-Pro aminopeptidase